MTIDELDQRMSEKEFVLWLRFAQEFFLPHRREQLQSAQIAQLISATAGVGKQLTEFIISPEGSKAGEDEPSSEFGGMVIGAMTSKRVIRLGAKRKDRGGG